MSRLGGHQGGLRLRIGELLQGMEKKGVKTIGLACNNKEMLWVR